MLSLSKAHVACHASFLPHTPHTRLAPRGIRSCSRHGRLHSRSCSIPRAYHRAHLDTGSYLDSRAHIHTRSDLHTYAYRNTFAKSHRHTCAHCDTRTDTNRHDRAGNANSYSDNHALAFADCRSDNQPARSRACHDRRANIGGNTDRNSSSHQHANSISTAAYSNRGANSNSSAANGHAFTGAADSDSSTDRDCHTYANSIPYANHGASRLELHQLP